MKINLPDYSDEQIAKRTADFCEFINKRRTVREFSNRQVPREAIENILMSASSAPSGANRQPWFFAAVSSDCVKQKIRDAAEIVERDFYEKNAPQDWLDALSELKTNWQKPFLTQAPWLIVAFLERYEISPTGEKIKNYYPTESVGLALGTLLCAVHNAGLATLTYTPSPAKFLSEILEMPENYRPIMVLPVGHPASDYQAPDISRKDVSQIAKFW